MTILASCSSISAANGDRSMPPKSGRNLRQVSNKGSVKLCKMDAVALKLPGFNQLNKARTMTAYINTLINKETRLPKDSKANAPIPMLKPFNINTRKSANICKLRAKTREEVSIFPTGGI